MLICRIVARETRWYWQIEGVQGPIARSRGFVELHECLSDARRSSHGAAIDENGAATLVSTAPTSRKSVARARA
jgi:hypothetical protein